MSILFENNIVILDEPSSQYDESSEKLYNKHNDFATIFGRCIEEQMQRAIRETISHDALLCILKLNSIMSFDMVIFIHKGVEVGSSRLLLQDSQTIHVFSRLIEHHLAVLVP